MSKKFFGHPIGLSTLFATELWERFSYYGMRALLVLYLTANLLNGGFGLSEVEALKIYGIFTGLVYLTPMLGGILADKYWGHRFTVYTGALIIAIGQFTLAASSLTDPTNIETRLFLLYTGLGTLILGNGLFKPNISTMVGALYDSGDARRDGGFTIFYMGINAGAFFAPLIAGSLGETAGWHWGFFAAGIGMIISTLWLWSRHKTLGNIGLPKNLDSSSLTLPLKYSIQIVLYTIIGTLMVWAIIWAITNIDKSIVNITVVLSVLALFSYVIYTIVSNTRSRDEWSRIGVIFILAFFSLSFWIGFEQAGGTFNIFARDNTNRIVSVSLFDSIAGFLTICCLTIAFFNYNRFKTKYRPWLISTFIIIVSYISIRFFFLNNKVVELPSSIFQSINPLAIFIIGPLFSYMWVWLDRNKLNPGIPYKFAIGLVFLSLGFWVMVWANKIAGNGMLISPLWLLAVYMLHTLGELCLSPIGLSMITKLSPTKIVSVMMGVWFASSAIGNYLAAVIKSMISGYNIDVFTFIAIETLVIALLAFAIAPKLTKMMKGVK